MEKQVQSAARTMRIAKWAIVASGFLFAFVAIRVPVPTHVPIGLGVEIAITFAGLGCVLGGFLLPRFVFRAAEHAPQGNSTEARLKRWRTKGILSLSYFEACVLFGLVLHFLEARTWLVGLLFGAGIASELIWNPGKPPGAEAGELPQT